MSCGCAFVAVAREHQLHRHQIIRRESNLTDRMDIHALDAIDPETDDSDDALARYVDGLMTPFLEAAPGVEAGWVAFFIKRNRRKKK